MAEGNVKSKKMRYTNLLAKCLAAMECWYALAFQGFSLVFWDRSIDRSMWVCGRTLRGKVSQLLVWFHNLGYVVSIKDFVILEFAVWCTSKICVHHLLINSRCSQWHTWVTFLGHWFEGEKFLLVHRNKLSLIQLKMWKSNMNPNLQQRSKTWSAAHVSPFDRCLMDRRDEQKMVVINFIPVCSLCISSFDWLTFCSRWHSWVTFLGNWFEGKKFMLVRCSKFSFDLVEDVN